MTQKILSIATAAIILSGCIATPRIDIPDHLTFDYQQVEYKTMSYNDVLCCYECEA